MHQPVNVFSLYLCLQPYTTPAISFATQLRFQHFKHVHVALDMQIIMEASKMDKVQAKGA